MWALIGAINIYNGFVVWLIERKYSPELKGSALNQIGVLLCSAFTTLFSLHGNLEFFFLFSFFTSLSPSAYITLFHLTECIYRGETT